ncbi:MAG: acyl-CoA synthetase [Christensenellales bacterium]
MRKVVAVIGDAIIEPNGEKYKLAFEAGKALVDNGYRVQSGGLKGIMEAAFHGARSSEKYREGDTIAIVPSFDKSWANKYADIVLPTGLDVYRNVIVANADAIVAIGGGSGTLSEIALGWALQRLIIGYKNVEGWSGKLAGTRIDQRVRYKNIADDMVYPVTNAQEMIDILNSKIDLYTNFHRGIINVDANSKL